MPYSLLQQASNVTNVTTALDNTTTTTDLNNNNPNVEIHDLDYYLTWSYSNGQVIALCAASTISSLLSLAGSISICRTITQDRRMRGRLYERFVLMVSSLDIVATCSILAGTYLIPANDNTELFLAMGTTHTCTAAAALFCYFTGVAIANMNLAVYFYLTVCRAWTDRYIQQHWERKMHVTACAIPTLLGIAVIVTQSGNPTVMGHLCAIQVYPPACTVVSDIECERGSLTTTSLVFLVSLFFSIVPFLLSCAATLRVTWAVTASTRRAMRAGSNAAVRREKKVRRQALLYLASYINTFLWPIVLAASETYVWQVHEAQPFVLALCANTLLPLQGFFNYFVFQRRSLQCFNKCYGQEEQARGRRNGGSNSNSHANHSLLRNSTSGPIFRAPALFSRAFQHKDGSSTSSSSAFFLSRRSKQPAAVDSEMFTSTTATPPPTKSPTDPSFGVVVVPEESSPTTSLVVVKIDKENNLMVPPPSPSRLPAVTEEEASGDLHNIANHSLHSHQSNHSWNDEETSNNKELQATFRNAASRLAGAPSTAGSNNNNNNNNKEEEEEEEEEEETKEDKGDSSNCDDNEF